jgi:hypothetical protein
MAGYRAAAPPAEVADGAGEKQVNALIGPRG